jgi:hypothetical protein
MLPQLVRMIVQPEALLRLPHLSTLKNLFRQPEPALTSAEYLAAAAAQCVTS